LFNNDSESALESFQKRRIIKVVFDLWDFRILMLLNPV